MALTSKEEASLGEGGRLRWEEETQPGAAVTNSATTSFFYENKYKPVLGVSFIIK